MSALPPIGPSYCGDYCGKCLACRELDAWLKTVRTKKRNPHHMPQLEIKIGSSFDAIREAANDLSFGELR